MVCDTCDHCDENVGKKEEEEEDIVQIKVEKAVEEFHKHGIGCGHEIAKIAREIQMLLL